MPISDVWADWTTSANSNTPAGSAIPEIDDEFRNVKAELKKNCVTLTGNQTIAGTKSFSSFPELTTAAPTTNGQAANKKYVDDAVAAGLQSLLASGTAMIFLAASAPVGWTQYTAFNDRVLRIVSGAGTGSGGDWNNAAGISILDHVISWNELAYHGHNYNDYTITNSTYEVQLAPGLSGIFIPQIADTGRTTDFQGANYGHNHGLASTGAWRPSYVDVIAAIRN